jgi:hypothetical protein
MKPRTLARHAWRMIENGTITFDTPERKKEGCRQVRQIINGVKKFKNDSIDPIVEWHIGVYIPNFDYPLVPLDKNGEPLVWEEDLTYHVCGDSTHTFRGISKTGEKYYLSHLDSLAPYKDVTIKVDRYTDLDRAAYALVSCMTLIQNKEHYEIDYGFKPILMEHDEVVRMWKENKKVDPNFAEETHMRILRTPKSLNDDPFNVEELTDGI